MYLAGQSLGFEVQMIVAVLRVCSLWVNDEERILDFQFNEEILKNIEMWHPNWNLRACTK